MVFRKVVQNLKLANMGKAAKHIVNERKSTYNDVVYPALPFMVRSRKYKIKTKYPFENNPAGQLNKLTYSITQLIRDERLRMTYSKACEVRNHTERLIVEAMRNGDRHRPTMDLANFYIQDKSMIHKLFKVLVPRYENYATAFTAMHKLGRNYSQYFRTLTELKELKTWQPYHGEYVVLELRGNPLPPITKPSLDKRNLLTNILIGGARQAMREKSVATEATSAEHTKENTIGV